jgi:hypothetical protein
MEKIYQGEVKLDGSTIVEAVDTALTVNTIIVNNLTTAYSFILYRRAADSPNNIIPIYKFDLDLGDTIRDSELYRLDVGDSLILVTNKKKTSYYISFTEDDTAN